MNLLNQKFKYIFVGGKGGVGKTTTSCSIALQIAQHDRSKKVLLISTDPAHNVSDALAQQFSSEIQQVNNVPNLYAVEIDPSQKLKAQQQEAEQENGIDEMVNFLEVIKLAKNNEYETIVFDTAPTGHTLRFLEIPKMAQNVFGQFQSIKDMIQPMFAMLGPLLQMSPDDMNGVFGKIEEMLDECKQIEAEFTNPMVTTFVGVCIPEFLSLYETERLVQHLARIDIDCSTIVVNQIINVNQDNPCTLCQSRKRMQQKYISQIDKLYENFDIIKMSLQEKEVRGVTELLQFGKNLIEETK